MNCELCSLYKARSPTACELRSSERKKIFAVCRIEPECSSTGPTTQAHRTQATAGMPKRDYTEFSGYVPSRTSAFRGETYRSVSNSARAVRPYAGPKRYRSNRFYSGRGVRPGSYMYRRFRGLRRYPQAGIETKFFDTSVAASAIQPPPASTTWSGLEQVPATVLCLNAPTQGTGASNREGRFITMESLQINGIVNLPSQIDQTSADNVPVIKIWIVMDKQTNGGTATGLDSENVYTNPAATALGGLSPLRNMLYSRRYKVLKEIVVEPKTLPVAFDGTNIEQEGVATSFECFIPLKGRKTEYLANAGTVADIVNNGLFVLAAANSTSTMPTLTYNARLRFRG